MSIKNLSVISVFVLLLMSTTLFSQNNANNNQQNVNSSNIYLHVEGGEKKVEDKTVKENISTYSLEQINYMIMSYKKKMDYISSNPDDDEMAKINGWYNKMEIALQKLINQREILLNESDEK